MVLLVLREKIVPSHRALPDFQVPDSWGDRPHGRHHHLPPRQGERRPPIPGHHRVLPSRLGPPAAPHRRGNPSLLRSAQRHAGQPSQGGGGQVMGRWRSRSVCHFNPLPPSGFIRRVLPIFRFYNKKGS